ncbi:MAG: hypothetical protein ACLQNG_13780 [Acidimicrobiales bacterium]
MSSLWTPDGEHKVPRPEDSGTSRSGPSAGSGGSPPPAPPSRGPAPERAGEAGADQPSEEELRQLARELSETPVEDIIANHCYGLFELAALHLSQQPVNLVAARLAIDAMGQLVDGLGERLGPHAGTLADGLTQLRLAFVRIAEAAATAAPSPAASPDAGAARATPADAASGEEETEGASTVAAAGSSHRAAEEPEAD